MSQPTYPTRGGEPKDHNVSNTHSENTETYPLLSFFLLYVIKIANGELVNSVATDNATNYESYDENLGDTRVLHRCP